MELGRHAVFSGIYSDEVSASVPLLRMYWESRLWRSACWVTTSSPKGSSQRAFRFASGHFQPLCPPLIRTAWYRRRGSKRFSLRNLRPVESLFPATMWKVVDPPIEGWCQTVPNEGNPRLILRLDPPIRSDLQTRAMSKSARVRAPAPLKSTGYPGSGYSC
jgi:hypothetical protein